MKHITALTLTTLLAATGLAQTAAAAAPVRPRSRGASRLASLVYLLNFFQVF